MARLNERAVIEEATRLAKLIGESELPSEYRSVVLQHLLGSPAASLDPAPSRSTLAVKAGSEATSPRPASEIEKLWREGFFVPPKPSKDVITELDRRGFHFGASATQKALQRAPFLRGEGRGLGARYHQRAPP
jgi:hypothetical protein